MRDVDSINCYPCIMVVATGKLQHKQSDLLVADRPEFGIKCSKVVAV